MNAKLNRELFTQTKFDSGALGVMASVIHQFARVGNYQATVLRNGKAVGSFGFAVEDDDKAMQLTIDLAAIAGQKRTRAGDDCLCDGAEENRLVVSSKGYVVFYVSTGAGYSVQVGQAGEKAAEFDSTKLVAGDFFTLVLLEPTTYSVAAGKAKAEITVSFKPADAKRLRELEAVNVDLKNEAFKPAAIRLISTQGLIFRIHDPQARIVVEKTGKTPPAEREVVYRWQKLKPKKR